MGRLTKWNANACRYCKAWCECLGEKPCYLYKSFERLKHYEDLEEQDRLIELPCAVGDTVWLVEKAFLQYLPIKFKFSRKSDIMREMEKGMIFTKTKEEAEAKLKELEG